MSNGTSAVVVMCGEGLAAVIHGMNQTMAVVQGNMQSGAQFAAEQARLGFMQAQTTVSMREATGQRMVTESGSGRTRAETNPPNTTGVGTGGT